jgi:MurNAc alpha-1-phosphate uridylyltransferase
MSITRAMILAAGRGERMRPLTDQLPKALLEVRGKPLIVYHLEKLSRLGLTEVVINLAWLGQLIRERLQDGSQWNLKIRYSDEAGSALETGGGIFRALPWLGADPFLIVNADVYTDFDFGSLCIASEAWAHLVMVPNPAERPRGDFSFRDGPDRAGVLVDQPDLPRYTYSGIGLYRRELFDGCAAGKFPLLPLYRQAIAAQRLHGQIYSGPWSDVGTVDRFAALQ